jgi:phosphoglucomutase
MQGLTVKTVPTKPIEGQKTGTSGLRKKTKVFMGEHYLANWCPACSHSSLHLERFCCTHVSPPHLTASCRIQSLFDSLGSEVRGKTIGLGGDGRYFNKEAVQIILKLAAGSGLKKVRLVIPSWSSATPA